jgi:hypothetical protein
VQRGDRVKDVARIIGVAKGSLCRWLHIAERPNGLAAKPHPGPARPGWTLDDFKAAVAQAKHGRIAVLQFHGVPDTAHDWVNSTRKQFESYMKYLADNKFTVIALRDLAKCVDPAVNPNDHKAIKQLPKLCAMARWKCLSKAWSFDG